MKSQEKEWREARRKGGDISADEAETPAVLPPRRAAAAAASAASSSAAAMNLSPITLKKPRKPPVKKTSAPNSGRSSLAASGTIVQSPSASSPAPSGAAGAAVSPLPLPLLLPPTSSPSPSPSQLAPDAKAVVAEMLKTDEEEEQQEASAAAAAAAAAADRQGFGAAVLESLAAAAMESDGDDDGDAPLAALIAASPPPTPASPFHRSLLSVVLETASAPAEMEILNLSTDSSLPITATGLRRSSTLLRKRMGKRPHSAITSPGAPDLSSSMDIDASTQAQGIITSTATPPPPVATEDSLEPPAKKRATADTELANADTVVESEAPEGSATVPSSSHPPPSTEDNKRVGESPAGPPKSPAARPAAAAAVAAGEEHPTHADTSQHCPMCGNTAHSYKSIVVDPTAEEMAVDERPHDRAEDLSLGKYMFYVLENHFANVACGEKFFVCPYPNCQSKFSIEFELQWHIDAVHVRELQRNLLLQPHPDNNSSLEPVYSISLDCDYHGCDATFPGTEAGRLERRRHIESVHLQLHKHQCECCDTPVYGSEANERRRQAELAGIPMKRGRGRPRKYPRPGENLPIPQPLLGPDGNPIKRGRGRPRKHPRSGDYDNGFDSEHYDGFGTRSSPDGGSRDRRGPGRPRKGSAGSYGIDSAASGSDSEMDNSSYDQSHKGPRISPLGMEKRGRMGSRGEPSSGGNSRSRSGSPSAKRGPGRPRKYPRDEFGHPIKPSQAGQNHRPSKRRKLAAALLAAQLANGVPLEEAKKRIKSLKQQSPNLKTQALSNSTVDSTATTNNSNGTTDASFASTTTATSTSTTTPPKASTSSSADAMDVDTATPTPAPSITPPPAPGKQSGKKKKKKKKSGSKKLLSPPSAAAPRPESVSGAEPISAKPLKETPAPAKKFAIRVDEPEPEAEVSEDDRDGDGDYLEKSKNRGSPKKTPKSQIPTRPSRSVAATPSPPPQRPPAMSPPPIPDFGATPTKTHATISLNTIDSASSPLVEAVVANLMPPPVPIAEAPAFPTLPLISVVTSSQAAPAAVAPVMRPFFPNLAAPYQQQQQPPQVTVLATGGGGFSLFGLADLCAAAEIEDPAAAAAATKNQ